MDRAVGAHGERGAQRFLAFGVAERDRHHLLGPACLPEADRLLGADLVERVHRHLDARGLDPRAIGLDADLDVEVDHALDRDEDLHGLRAPW
jgi:hypothetical protein